MFQTAFPFGYLIQFVFLVGAVVTACVLIVRGRTRRDAATFRAGLVLAGIVALMIGLAAAQPRVDDWNPRYQPDVLYGEWVDGERSLHLRADGTYTLRDGSSVTNGRYEPGDWDFRLMDASGRRPLPMPPLVLGLRVVVVDGEYRIINDPYEPDAWDGWLGYRRVPPAVAP